MKNYVKRDTIHNIYNTFQTVFPSGNITIIPGLYIPVNKYGLGVNGIRKDATIVNTSFVSGLGEFSFTDIYALSIFKEDDIRFDTGNQLGALYSYDGFNNYTINVSCWIYKEDWANSKTEYILDNYGNSSNRFSIYKNTSNEIVLYYRGSGTTYSKTLDVSALTGAWHHFTFQVDTVNTLDGTNYLKIFIDYNVSTAVSSTKPSNRMTVIETESHIGSDYQGNNQFNGYIGNLTIDNFIWKDTIANASTAGLGRLSSVQGNYTDIRSVCDENCEYYYVVE